MNWWHSAESVERATSLANWTVAVLGLLAAAAAVIAVVLNSRAAELKAADDAKRESERLALREQVITAETNTRKLQLELSNADRQLRALQPRRLTPEQRQTIISALQRVKAPPKPFLIATISTDTEASTFARDLRAAIEAAGWRTEFAEGVYSTPEYDTTVEIQDRAIDPTHAGALHRALVQAGVPADMTLNRHLNPGIVRLFVGHRRQTNTEVRTPHR